MTGDLATHHPAGQRHIRFDLDDIARAEVAADPSLRAEIGSDAGHWHVIACLPAHERTAAAHLTARGFVTYLPFWRDTRVIRGRKVDRERLIFPSYVLLFAWSLDAQWRKVASADGVSRILMAGDRAAILPDAVVDDIRAIENRLNLLNAIRPEKRRKRQGWRARRRAEAANDATQYEIIQTRSWSAFQDSDMTQLDDAGRTGLLLRALEVPACR